MNLPAPVEAAIFRAADKYRLSPYALLLRSQHKRLVQARREVYAELREQGFALAWIAKWFNVTHSNVHHHLKSAAGSPRVRIPVLTSNKPDQFKRDCPQFCSHCGYRGSGLVPEDYHFICKDKTACTLRYEKFLIFCQDFAKELRRNHK